MNELLCFKPIYQERVWGGTTLKEVFNRPLGGSEHVGESWEIVDRKEAQSVVERGSCAGLTLREVIEKHAPEVMGPSYSKNRPFPILVKWLDCKERLSLQVHPPASIAASLKGEPKTENWYIASTTSNAQLIVGLKKGVTKAQFEAALESNTLEACVHKFPVAAGDSILVHSGEVHAIDAGNLILEIQQNSDTTYRVYDWGRVGLDGKPRSLHVQESLASIDWNHFEPEPVRGAPTSGVIADCDEFSIRRLVLGAGESVTFNANEMPRILSLVSGKVSIKSGAKSGKETSQLLEPGSNGLLPYAGSFEITAESTSIVIVTEDFT